MASHRTTTTDRFMDSDYNAPKSKAGRFRDKTSGMNRREWMQTTFGGSASLFLPRRARAAIGTPYRYVHLDVFTDRKLAGNQLLTYVDPQGLDTETMARLTIESNYSENTFIFPAEEAGIDFRVRIFTRGGEVPFAGHPTIGSAFALAYVGRITPGTWRTVFGLGVGPTPLDLEWNSGTLAFAWMTQLKPTFGKSTSDRAAVASAIGLQPSDLAPGNEVPAAQEVHTGSNFIIVPLATRKAVDAAIVDRGKMDAVRTASGITGRGVYVFTTERGDDGATSYSRLLGGPGGIEDPATGSAAGPAGCFMVRYGFVPADKANAIVNVQGVLVKRPSRIHINIALSGTEISSVKVGGESVVVAEGTANI
jgi:trans-2,3-dihydro-3-hydroxyanthranilate isomerase